jgi:hypothetical protein
MSKLVRADYNRSAKRASSPQSVGQCASRNHAYASISFETQPVLQHIKKDLIYYTVASIHSSIGRLSTITILNPSLHQPAPGQTCLLIGAFTFHFIEKCTRRTRPLPITEPISDRGTSQEAGTYHISSAASFSLSPLLNFFYFAEGSSVGLGSRVVELVVVVSRSKSHPVPAIYHAALVATATNTSGRRNGGLTAGGGNGRSCGRSGVGGGGLLDDDAVAKTACGGEGCQAEIFGTATGTFRAGGENGQDRLIAD